MQSGFRSLTVRYCCIMGVSSAIEIPPIVFGIGFVGADAHIGPLGSCEFAEDCRKNSTFCWGDVGIAPYA